MLEHVKHYAEKAGSDCFVCFISSHGDLSSIACVEKKRTSVEIEELFKKANTSELTGHPKVFFIDACRSGNFVFKIFEWQRFEDVYLFQCFKSMFRYT